MRYAMLALTAALAVGCSSDCAEIQDYYDDCCAECGENDILYCAVDVGSDEEVCEALLVLLESEGTSLDDIGCFCGGTYKYTYK